MRHTYRSQNETRVPNSFKGANGPSLIPTYEGAAHRPGRPLCNGRISGELAAG